MSATRLPKSKAKTAYGLLTEIRKLILEEPKRYNQKSWKTEQGALTVDLRPACGTTCCVAGWVDQLKSSHPVPETAEWQEMAEVVPRRARRILGISSKQGSELFDEYAAGRRFSLATDQPDLVGHAQRGAQHIAKFQQQYAAQLKAKRV